MHHSRAQAPRNLYLQPAPPPLPSRRHCFMTLSGQEIRSVLHVFYMTLGRRMLLEYTACVDLSSRVEK